MGQSDNGANFAPLINAYVIYLYIKRTSCLGSASAVHTDNGNAEPTGDPFLLHTVKSVGNVQLADNGQMGAGGN